MRRNSRRTGSGAFVTQAPVEAALSAPVSPCLPPEHSHFFASHRDQLISWCLRTVVLEKSPESPFDSKEITPVNLKGDQPWTFPGRTDAEAEAQAFWSSDANRQLIRKVPGAGEDWGQKEKTASEDEMAGRRRRYNEHGLGQSPGDGEGQEGLAGCSLWGHKELDMAGWLDKNNNSYKQTRFLPRVLFFQERQLTC